MNDTIKLLNLKDDDVAKLDVFCKDNIIYYEVTLNKKPCECPSCGYSNPRIDSYKKRLYNFPANFLLTSKILYHQRRFECPICKKTFNEKNPFSNYNKKTSFTESTFVMDLLKKPDFTFTSVANFCKISPTKVQTIFDKHFKAPRIDLPRVLSIDEYYDPSTGVGKYDCLLIDFETNKVIDILSDRRKQSLSRELQSRTREHRYKVEFVSIDMWETYRDIARIYFPKAKVCVDSFHVIKNLNESLNKIRIRIMNSYDFRSTQYYLLKEFHWLLLMNFSNIKVGKEKPYNHRLGTHADYKDILSMMLNINEELKAAYLLKERYIDFNKNSTIENAKENIEAIINAFEKNTSEEFFDFYKLLKNWKDEIVNSFNLDCNGKRINNSLIESKNSSIKKIIRNANGYKNFTRLKNRIIYCLNSESTMSFDELSNNVKSKYEKRGPYVKTPKK